jgi:pyruvate dehydrogenase E1 component
MAANSLSSVLSEGDVSEVTEWIESLVDVLHREGPDRVRQLLVLLQEEAYRRGVTLPFTSNTPYINTIHREKQPRFPGNREIERRIKSIVRWNAMAMVVRANREHSGLGGHISTFASAATLYEIGFNHFFRAPSGDHLGDMVYFQGHASPGIYARAFVEGRLTEQDLSNFRQELAPTGGLSSYPHPWLMPGFWQFPTVSMGLGPIMAIYHARFLRYLQHRGLLDTSASKVWCFVGDGEVDEPETLGAINLATREKLDNLIFVINCNLQRLDGPVRGNGKIIQELEAGFRGSGWNVIKVIWGGDWDPLLAADGNGLLMSRMWEVVDGQYQKYIVENGAYIRDHFFGTHPELQQLVSHLSDEQIQKLKRGGHDPEKVYAAYKAAVEHVGAPSVILAKTIKGYGLGEAGEGKNISHQQKSINEDELREFRSRFSIPISDEEVAQAPFYRPAPDSQEMAYLQERRRLLGGSLPQRRTSAPKLDVPGLEAFKELLGGSGDREFSTTGAFGRALMALLKNKAIGKNIVPIIPDEARTFGMEGFFSQFGIYASTGQLYEPVDAGQLSYYREAKDGQILEEGINEAGAMSSFVAAGTAAANLGISMVPFYIYYSMFGFQRVGDFIWLAADSRCKGFLLGATAGRTTLNGEGLQHEDGHSHLMAATVPNCLAYDPGFAYEVAVIIQDGLRRMYVEDESVFYYITLYNEPYVMPALPEGANEGILKGMYLLKSAEVPGAKSRVQLLGSGPILRQTLLAQETLARDYGVASDLYSVTSYKELRREALEVERWNLLHPTEKPRQAYVQKLLHGKQGPFIAASDYMHLVSEQIAKWVPDRRLVTLGTDGFGRSDTRENLRRHFEIDAAHITFAALSELHRRGEVDRAVIEKARQALGIDPDKKNPVSA